MDKRDLSRWCGVPVDDLPGHPELRVPLRLTTDSSEMGRIMAHELVDEIVRATSAGKRFRAIIPCGPSSWYEPFVHEVNRNNVSLRTVEVFHMDECLDWQGRLLPRAHPYSFRGAMERQFYSPIRPELAVLPENRNWLEPATMVQVEQKIASAPIDIAYGGWGQDGHVAYNQARRNPFNSISIDELRASTIRVQDNNVDTIIALGQRAFGGAYQLVPPMSVTLGMRQILSAKRVRLFSDTGEWKQTALRIGLFSPLDPEYPVTLLQEHPDALLTATRDTADHPISRHPEWDFGFDTEISQAESPSDERLTPATAS